MPETTPHPWYGPCDALGPGGRCAECMKDDQGNPQTTPHPWGPAILRLSVHVSPNGVISFSADDPRNLSVSGLSLQEAFNEFVIFAQECEAMGRPFDALKGVKLQ